MARLLSSLIFFVFVGFIAWPYISVYRLSGAVSSNNQAALAEMVDMEEVQKTYRASLQAKIDSGAQMVGLDNNVDASGFAGIFQSGARVLGDITAETQVDLQWVQFNLQTPQGSLWDSMAHGFFESPTRFVVRMGELGNNPRFIEMQLQDWTWRVIAVHV